ncbi:hypothetical protein BRADI_4g31925v3 [Brachypodium distachyon]|uniref:Uncharacterized protein n=1 Tax=Brachypodium distachyon TaxID=15368 RepID=A0A2K2CRR4_BRADI|nr:hypothetical protein BRADI_4g31925v3 [Brachypodium distachyon]
MEILTLKASLASIEDPCQGKRCRAHTPQR